MTTAYTSLLGLALPVTGELSGTWGDEVNNYITSYLDAAVAGAQTISGTQTAVTLSTTNGLALTQAGSSNNTGSAQYQIINCTGNPASALIVTVPTTSKVYLVLNNTSTNQTVTVKGASTTGVTVAAAQSALIAWNGTDYVLVASTDVSKLAGTLATANGGTGQTTYTDGQLLIGNTATGSLTKATLTAGSGVAIANGNGSITISAPGLGGTVSSVGVSGGTTGLTTSGGPITTSGTITLGGTLAVANGGTGQTTTPANGQLLIGNGSGYTVANLTAGTGCTINNSAGNITINAIGSGGSVTSVGMTVPAFLSVSGSPVTTTGTLAVSYSGTALPVANGGTGQTTYTNGQLLIGNTTGNTLAKATLTAGTGISVTNGAGSITIASTVSGTVTSVAVSGGTTGLTTSGGPITSSGTITLAGTLTVGNGGTGATTFTSGGILRGNGTSALSVASASDIVTAIGSTAVTNATNATNATTAATVSTTVASGATGTTQAVGNNTTKIATTAFVLANSIGWAGYTDVTSSRAWSTTYTNSTGRPLFVSISFGDNGPGTFGINIYINGALFISHGVDFGGDVQFIVPVGGTYSGDSAGPIGYWFEM